MLFVYSEISRMSATKYKPEKKKNPALEPSHLVQPSANGPPRAPNTRVHSSSDIFPLVPTRQHQERARYLLEWGKRIRKASCRRLHWSGALGRGHAPGGRGTEGKGGGDIPVRRTIQKGR